MTSEATGGEGAIRGVVLQFFSLACAASVLNGYLIQPLLSMIGTSLGLEGALLGFAPALIQLGIALGVLLLLPLADRISNRLLVCGVIGVQIVALLTMASAEGPYVFLAAAFALGFTTITPYVLPAYVSRRVEPERLGEVTGVMQRGVTIGILAARVGAPLLLAVIGWRLVYVSGAVMMVIMWLALASLISDESPGARGGYVDLLASLGPAIVEFKALRQASIIQALSFGSFNALWILVGLQVGHIDPGGERGVMGALGALAVIAALIAPRAGRWADRLSPTRVRTFGCMCSFAGWLCLLLSSHLGAMVVAIVLISIGGVTIDISNRSLLMPLSIERRTRLLTVYTVSMFAGGACASWLATTIWDFAGWASACSFGVAITIIALAFALRVARSPAGEAA